MGEVFGELAPVFLLIALGFTAREARIVTPEAFGQVNRFGYFILYPAFLFSLSANADFGNADLQRFILGLMLGLCGMIALALAMRLIFRGDGPAYTSVFQGSVRWNGFVLLAAAHALYGPSGPALIGLAFGPMVLVVNLVCVVALGYWGEKRSVGWRALADQVLVNPLILSCAAGLAFGAMGWRDLGPATNAMHLLGAAAMPIALVCVGAGLDFKSLRASGSKVGATCVAKLMIAPLLMWWAATLCGASPVAAAVAAGVGSTPTAAAGYIAAHEMGGDARLMAAIITATTLLSFITMPIAISLASH